MKKTIPLIEPVRAVVIIAICIVVPLFMRDYYFDIDEAKFAAYRMIIFIAIPLVACFSIANSLNDLKTHALKEYVRSLYKNNNYVNLSMIIYGAVCILSFAAGGYYYWTFWGASGWYMGLFTQLSCIFLYFCASGSNRYKLSIIRIILGVSVIVCFLTVLNALYIDPLGCYKDMREVQIPMYLSTIGGTSWLGQYMVLIIPFAVVGIIRPCKNTLLKVSKYIIAIIVFSASILQNGDGVYVSIFVIFCIIGLYASKDSDLYKNWWISVGLFFLSALIDKLLITISPNPYVEYDIIPKFLLNPSVSFIAFVISFIAVLLIWRSIANNSYSPAIARSLLLIIITASALLVAIAIILLYLSTRIELPSIISNISYLNWSDEWGNQRGWNWSYSSNIYAQYPVKMKLLGTGPDGYFCYASEFYYEQMRARFGDNLYVFNAHNEYLNMLICMGLVGLLSYIFIFFESIRTMLRVNMSTNPKLINWNNVAILSSISAYMLYAFFTYQTVIGTPMLFIMIGLGASASVNLC